MPPVFLFGERTQHYYDCAIGYRGVDVAGSRWDAGPGLLLESVLQSSQMLGDRVRKRILGCQILQDLRRAARPRKTIVPQRKRLVTKATRGTSTLQIWDRNEWTQQRRHRRRGCLWRRVVPATGRDARIDNAVLCRTSAGRQQHGHARCALCGGPPCGNSRDSRAGAGARMRSGGGQGFICCRHHCVTRRGSDVPEASPSRPR